MLTWPCRTAPPNFLSADAAAGIKAFVTRESTRGRESIQTRDRTEFAPFDGGDRASAADVSFYAAVARVR